jgi:hypothetical protein
VAGPPLDLLGLHATLGLNVQHSMLITRPSAPFVRERLPEKVIALQSNLRPIRDQFAFFAASIYGEYQCAYRLWHFNQNQQLHHKIQKKNHSRQTGGTICIIFIPQHDKIKTTFSSKVPTTPEEGRTPTVI